MNILGLIGTIGICLSTNISTKEKENNLNSKLFELGFSQSEIDNMDEEKKDRFSKIELLATEKSETKHQEKITIDYKTYTSSSNNYSLSLTDEELEDAYINNITKYIDIDHLITKRNLKKSSSNKKAYVISDNEKTLSTTVSYIKENNEYKIFVKQNLKWNKTPSSRLTDIFLCNYTDNIRVDEKSSLPNSEMVFSYKKTVYNKKGWKHGTKKYTEKTVEKNITENFDSTSNEFYQDVGNYIGYKIKMPANTKVDGSSQRYYLITKINYSDFNLSMENTFKTNFADLTGTEILPSYSHQIESWNIDWSQLTIQPTPPFVSFTLGIFNKRNVFDDGIGKSISITF